METSLILYTEINEAVENHLKITVNPLAITERNNYP